MKKSGLIYIILAGILWGTSGIFVKYLTPYGVTSLQKTFIRGLTAFACMGIFALILGEKLSLYSVIGIILISGSVFLLSRERVGQEENNGGLKVEIV